MAPLPASSLPTFNLGFAAPVPVGSLNPLLNPLLDRIHRNAGRVYQQPSKTSSQPLKKAHRSPFDLTPLRSKPVSSHFRASSNHANLSTPFQPRSTIPRSVGSTLGLSQQPTSLSDFVVGRIVSPDGLVLLCAAFIIIQVFVIIKEFRKHRAPGSSKIERVRYLRQLLREQRQRDLKDRGEYEDAMGIWRSGYRCLDSGDLDGDPEQWDVRGLASGYMPLRSHLHVGNESRQGTERKRSVGFGGCADDVRLGYVTESEDEKTCVSEDGFGPFLGSCERKAPESFGSEVFDLEADGDAGEKLGRLGRARARAWVYLGGRRGKW